MPCSSGVKWCNGPGSFGQVCRTCQELAKKSASSPSPSPLPAKSVASKPLPITPSVSPPTPLATPKLVAPPKPVAVPSSVAPPKASAAPSSPPPVKTFPPAEVSGFTIGALLGTGSYKTAYAITGDTSKVLVCAQDQRNLEKEINDLATLKKAGVRTVEVYGPVQDLGGGYCGVVMENLKTVGALEIKETRFSMSAEKGAFLAAARGYGFDRVIAQLQAIDNYVKRPGNNGISDLQCVVSPSKGAVLFDPATLGTSEKNGGPAAMIRYLNSQKDL